MGRGGDPRDDDGGEGSRTRLWFKLSAADIGFVVCILVISSAVGVAFENALAAGPLAYSVEWSGGRYGRSFNTVFSSATGQRG